MPPPAATPRAPAVVLLALVAAWVLHLVRYTPRLPARVATHFGASGRPDGWMERSSFVILDVILLVFLLGLLVGVAFLTRHLPPGLVNVPHREHWFAPERQAQSHARLFRHMLWLACLVVTFLIAVNHAVFAANLGPGPVALSNASVLVMVGVFLIGLIAWTVRLYRLFPRPPATSRPRGEPGGCLCE